ncbi:hypothetical protein [Blastomonas sp. AAP53]|uniref:hypothetical protein n=1 Tax=Blastomonas sp. AAP53 TaxID=1248760 RepID=UPI00126725E2|nr:hypothetical protein [Blastomonas sp. AAP53]
MQRERCKLLSRGFREDFSWEIRYGAHESSAERALTENCSGQLEQQRMFCNSAIDAALHGRQMFPGVLQLPHFKLALENPAIGRHLTGCQVGVSMSDETAMGRR